VILRNHIGVCERPSTTEEDKKCESSHQALEKRAPKHQLTVDEMKTARDRHSRLREKDESTDIRRAWISPTSKLRQHIENGLFDATLQYTFLQMAGRNEALPGQSSSIAFQLEVCELLAALVDRGAKGNTTDTAGCSALHYAAGVRNGVVVWYLLQYLGVNPNVNPGRSPLCSALKGPHPTKPETHDAVKTIVELLIPAGNSPFDVQDELSFPFELEQCALNMVEGGYWRDDLQTLMLQLVGVANIPPREDHVVIGKRWRKSDFLFHQHARK